MKRFGVLCFSLAVAMLALAGAAAAQCDAILSDGLGPSGGTYGVGETIEYYVTLSCPVGSCELTVDQIDFFPPPGSGDACDDTPIYTITPGTVLIPGAAPIVWTVAEWPDLAYTVQTGDVGTDLMANICTKFSWESGGIPLDDEDTATSINFTDCPDPCLDITKEVDCDMSKVGDMVTYEICITNCGPYFDLVDVEVHDALLASTYGSPLPGFPSVLAPGEEYCAMFDYEIQPGDDNGMDYPNAMVTNTASVTATDACDDAMTFTVYSDEVTVYLVHPSFTVEKVCVESPVPQGQEYGEFDITITNTGDIDLDITTDETEIPSIMSLDPDGVYQHRVSRDCVDFVASNTITAEAMIASDVNDCNLPNVIGPHSATATCDCPSGENGCTPGFWKTHPDCWCDRFEPTDMLGDVFTIPSELSEYADDTLMAGLKFGGGSGVDGAARNLFRSAVAAILNGCSPDVPYPMSADGVIDAVNAALATLDRHEILAQHAELDELNNLGCSIDAHCNPISMEDEGIYPTN
jgi:hypothetical protein